MDDEDGKNNGEGEVNPGAEEEKNCTGVGDAKRAERDEGDALSLERMKQLQIMVHVILINTPVWEDPMFEKVIYISLGITKLSR